MSQADEVRLWRWPEGGFWPKGSDADPQYIALPLARHAALMRVVEAARALLDLLAYEHPDFGYSEIADLRAALAARPAQAGEGEWVWSRENDDDAWAIVHRRGPNRPEKITVAAYDAQRVCLLLNAAAAPSRPGGAAPPAPDAALLDRVVLIDHTPEMRGRVYDKAGVSVEMQMQDNGRTLKVFVQSRAVAHGGPA